MPLFTRTDGYRVLESSGVQTSHTGDTNETVLKTINIPAGAMGPNGVLRVNAQFSMTNNANAKTPRIRLGGLGGTVLADPATAGSSSVRINREIVNRNSQSSQVSSGTSITNTFGASSVAISTAAIDTSAATTLVLTGQLGVGTDAIAVESFTVEIRYAA